MTVSSGTRLGPYEILGSIGAGGMGEVFRAHDTRLDRDVALKVLPAVVAMDPDRLQRFEQEARATAALNHPNILVVHDVGTDRNIPYVVSELLEGQTLRQLLESGAVPPRKAAEYAIQIANGLAAAHDRGIVHRDLKPENIFVTKDGRAKILDFGLAKLVSTLPDGVSQATALNTDPGTVLGTAGYMSPEQLRGETVDHRSDIFALGAILYELFSHERAFKGRTAVETMSAILKEDPPELATAAAGVSPAIERVIRRCLEKSPGERFQSARDVTFALDAVSTTSASSAAHRLPEIETKRRPSLALALAAGAVFATAAAIGAYAIGVRGAGGPVAQPTFKQLTFRAGTVRGARFAPDGNSVVYAAAWEGKDIELFAVREQSPESSAVSLPPADLLGISPAGEMAISLKAKSVSAFVVTGTLARAPLAGGAARELIENVVNADWSADGKQMAVIRSFSNPSSMRVEYPLGTVLYSAPFWISNVRIARDGAALAFITHSKGGDEGDVETIDLASKQRRTLSAGWISIEGLAWAPGGREVWFTGTRAGGMRAIWAVSLDGRERLVYRAPQRLTLLDVTAAGRALVSGSTMRSETQFGSIREKVERNLSWFDWATGVSLSADARMLAFTESGEGAGEKYGVYVRPTDGSPAIRLGNGSTRSISPDGKWVAATFDEDRSSPSLQILPTGAGDTRTINLAPLERSNGARWFPDSRRLVVTGNEKGHKIRSYQVSLDGGPLKPISPEGIAGLAISPDGRWLAVGSAAASIPSLLPLDGGPAKALPAATASDALAGWTADSRSLLVRTGLSPVQIARIDIESGARTPVGAVAPRDTAGVVSLGAVAFAPDGDHYVFNYFRVLSELYIVDGLK